MKKDGRWILASAGMTRPLGEETAGKAADGRMDEMYEVDGMDRTEVLMKGEQMGNVGTEVECCPRFEPGPWDGREFEWAQKRFVKDKVFTIFYMPVGFGKVIRRLMAKTGAAGAVNPDNMCLCDHTSKWNMDMYLAVDKEIPGAANTTISGKFVSKVYEGDFKEAGKWCKDFAEWAKAKGLNLKKEYMWYTTCPICAKKWGKNYVVIIGEV